MNSTAMIVLTDGFEETEAVTIIDILRRAGVSLDLVGLTSLEVKGSHDIILKTEHLFTSFDADRDAIILPGGPGTSTLAETDELLERIRDYFTKGKLCAAICAAPSVFGKAGILEGRKATCFPGFEEKLTKAQVVENPVVRDGNVITSRGVGTAIPFALAVATYLTDEITAHTVADKILYSG